LKPRLPVTVETVGTVRGVCPVNEEYGQEYKDLVND